MGGRATSLPLGELVPHREHDRPRQSIYHKNLMPVVYVTGDVAGAMESPVYAILQMNKALDELKLPEGYKLQRHTAQPAASTARSTR